MGSQGEAVENGGGVRTWIRGAEMLLLIDIHQIRNPV